MIKRVVFLDLDGVVNTVDTLRSGRACSLDLSRYVDPNLLQKLRDFTRKDPNLEFVGVSSWFCGSDWDDIRKVAEFLDLPLFDSCSYCGGGHGRGLSVLDYVVEHKLTHWAVLDDAGGYMYSFPTVNVNARIGVTDFDLITLKNILDTETDAATVASYRKQQDKSMAMPS